MSTLLKSLALVQAKERLEWINASITRTVNRSYQLLAFIIAINVYLLQGMIVDIENPIFTGILLLSTPFNIVIIYHLYFAIQTMTLRSPGTDPDKSKDSMSRDEDHFYNTKLFSIQISINKNAETLSTVARNLNISLKLTIAMVIVLMLSLFAYIAST